MVGADLVLAPGDRGRGCSCRTHLHRGDSHGQVCAVFCWWSAWEKLDVRSSVMSQDLQNDTVLSNVIAGLPKVAELIATVPAERRPKALAAAEESYFRTARALGYREDTARQWSSVVMSRLREEMPLAGQQR
jgi:hypothetical protein